MAADHTPQRIASLQPSATVILATLRRLDRIVACTRYCVDLCPAVAAASPVVISDSWTAKSDEILGARPDLVIAAVPYQEKALTEILRSGSRFLGLAPRSLNDIYTDIATIAGAVGVPEQGERVIARMQCDIEAIRSRTNGGLRPRVFCEEWGKPLIASQPWVGELVAAAGGEFIGEAGQQRSPEQIAASDPEVIIAAWCGAGDRVPLAKIIHDRGWDQTHAARHCRVYCIRDEFLNTPAPTLIQGLHALAAAIHPELFPQAPGLKCITEVLRRSSEQPSH